MKLKDQRGFIVEATCELKYYNCMLFSFSQGTKEGDKNKIFRKRESVND